MIYPGKYNQDWVLLARQAHMTCPLYEEFFQFLVSGDLLEKEEKAHSETLLEQLLKTRALAYRIAHHGCSR